MNRLGGATSPYLLQHAQNPVDWWEWGPDAFAEAGRRDVPVFLSVGYAACHWCHVMAHESFEDQATADVLNAGFVSIKVDREERPDIDSVYMAATEAMTGQGGWPMSVMLTPEGEPFFAGTYFPAQARSGVPSFRDLLAAVTQAWTERRQDVERFAGELAERLRGATQSSMPAPSADRPLDAARAEELSSAAVEALAGQYDRAHGGFGGAPKFPPAMTCAFLLRRAERVGDHTARDIAVGTLDAIVRGGIYDQVGGGLARYSVDAGWRVPHFEKMLSDNALLLDCLLRWQRLTGSQLAERAARETADFLLSEMATLQGGFAASLDADSEGGEGAFYTWTPGELGAALGDDAEWAAAAYDVSESGQLEGGRSTLTLHRDPDDLQRLGRVREALAAARDRRPRPARDDKVVAAWNGLAIGALAEASKALEEPRYAEAAARSADLLLALHTDDDGRLLRTSRDGRPGAAYGVLEDYACLADGLLALHAVTHEQRWRDAAAGLLAGIDERFGDAAGGLFDTASDAEALIARPRTPVDGATPAGQAVIATALVRLSHATGDETHLQHALALVTPLTGIASRSPRHGATALSVLEMLLTVGWPA